MPSSFRILIAALLLLGLTGCYAHQRKHSVVRIWADYNSYRQCSVCMEELDHKPLRAARVGAFIWAYGRDPGHQNAYAEARQDWEALVAQRLNEATEAANGDGAIVSGAPAGCPVESGSPPTLVDENLPPTPDRVQGPNTPINVPPAPAAESPSLESAPNDSAPAADDSLDAAAGLRVPAGQTSKPMDSPRRLPTNLPQTPPGVSTDGLEVSAAPAHQLSGYSSETSVSTQSRRPTSQEPSYRRPAGSWLFSRP